MRDQRRGAAAGGSRFRPAGKPLFGSRLGVTVWAAILAIAAAGLSACGGAPTLSKDDADLVAVNRTDLSRAIETTRKIAADPAQARHLATSVTRTLAAYGALKGAAKKSGAPGQFQSAFGKGLAQGALQGIGKDVPSLVDDPSAPSVLVPSYARAFIAKAVKRPLAALHAPAADATSGLIRNLASRSGDTKLPSSGDTAASVLRGAAVESAPYWPDLSRRLGSAMQKGSGDQAQLSTDYLRRGNAICKQAVAKARGLTAQQFEQLASVRAAALASFVRLQPPDSKLRPFATFLASFEQGQMILGRIIAAIGAADVAAARRYGHQFDVRTPTEDPPAKAAGLTECAK
jgi:hypothetical protein